MGDLSNFESTISRLKAFDFQKEMTDAIVSGKEELLNLQATQMFSGIDNQGGAITLDGEGYSPFTVAIKKEKGQPTDRVTLRDSGALYSGLDLKVNGSVFDITSPVPYFDELQQRTGEKAFLPDESSRLQFANDVVLPTVASALLDKTGLVITSK